MAEEDRGIESKRKEVDGKELKVDSKLFESSKVDPIKQFDQMGLKQDLLKGIYAYGFEKPSAIQQRAIEPILKGRDVIAQSQSGTGKTTIFSIGVLQTINTQSRETQALVVTNQRIGRANKKCNDGLRRLFVCALSCVHWWEKYWGGYSNDPIRSSLRFRHSWSSL